MEAALVRAPAAGGADAADEGLEHAERFATLLPCARFLVNVRGDVRTQAKSSFYRLRSRRAEAARLHNDTARLLAFAARQPASRRVVRTEDLTVDGLQELLHWLAPLENEATAPLGLPRAQRFDPKRHSPCLEFGYHSDGVAILWKKSAFAPIGSERRFFIEDDGSESGRPYLLALLRHRECDSTLLVATTHMKAKLSQPNEDLRAKQITQLLDALEESAADKADAVMLCGDFNTDGFVEAARAVCEETGAGLDLIQGEELLRQGYGGLWTVGKAAEGKPALAILKHEPEGAERTICWIGKEMS